MTTENVTLDFFEELMLHAKSDDFGSRCQAASMIMERCGDPEMAAALRVMSAQMDFDSNDEASEAIGRTRSNLDRLIAERKARHSMSYIKTLTDEEIRALSNGEVTETDYDELESQFIEKGLFDPDIFGGSGRIPYCDERTGHVPNTSFGLGIGHIELPVHCVFESNYSIIADLLHLTPEDVYRVAKYSKRLVIEPGDAPLSKYGLLSEKDYMEYRDCTGFKASTGGDAIYEALCALGYADQPERMAFKVLPVMSPRIRPMAYSQKENMYCSHPLNESYCKVISQAYRLKRLMDLHAPEIIWRNEARILDDKVNELVATAVNCFQHNVWRIPKQLLFIRAQLALVKRKRNMSARRLTKEELHKTEDIVSLGIYPENICLLDDSGNVTPIPLRRVFDTNTDVVFNIQTAGSSGLPTDTDSPADEETNARTQELVEKMEKNIHNIFVAAVKEREACTVRLDRTGMYMLVTD